MGKTPAQIVFRFAVQAGIQRPARPIPDHMREDLDIHGFALSDEDVRLIENIGQT